MQATPIRLPELYGSSHLLHFLYQALGRVLTVPGACLLWAAAQSGLFAVLCWSQGTLLPQGEPGRMSLVEDTTALSYYFLLPLCFLLLHHSLRLFQLYLNHLPEVLDPTAPPEAHADLLEIARTSFSPTGLRRPRLLLAAIGLCIFGFNALANFQPGLFYGRPHKWDGIEFPISFTAARLYVLFVWVYALPLWLSEVYTQMAVMGRINQRMAERGWLRVSPYAADGFGGLARLAQVASWVGYLLFAVGLFFLAPLLRSALWDLPLHAGNYIGLVLYALLVTAGTVAPVYMLHRILAQKKSEVLSFFAAAFETSNSRVLALVKENNVKGLGEEELGRALEAIHRVHAQWSALPVWPLNAVFFVKVVVAVVSPAALLALQQITRRWAL